MSATTLSPTAIPTGTYAVDPSHSNVGFEVRHMGIATVRGSFKKFTGSIDATGDSPRLDGAVEVSSIDTGDENRDGHLQAPDFFDVERNPQITFHSTATESGDADDQIKLVGEITIKGVTKPLELTGTLAENGQDPWGNERVGFEVSGTIDRRDFDLTWNQTLPNGNLLVSNQVKLVVSVSAVKQA
jgi:polyisoprenoid-binding protein YceI